MPLRVMRPTKDLDIPTVIRFGLWTGGDVDPISRLRFMVHWIDWVLRVTSREIFWR